MKNNIEYYQHFTDADQHPKFKMLRVKYGWAGEGKFWALNNRIAQAENCQLDIGKKYNEASMAHDLDFTLEEFREFINYLDRDCGLIIKEDSLITTEIVSENLDRVMKKRVRNQEDYRQRLKDTLRNSQNTETKIQTSENIQSKVKESKVKESKEYAENSTEFQLASLLISSILKFKKDWRQPTNSGLQGWCSVFNLIINRDKRSVDRTKQLIEWLPTDYHPGEKWQGWAPNIMSAKKFREQWDKLDLAEQNSRKKSNHPLNIQHPENINKYQIQTIKQEIEKVEFWIKTDGPTEEREQELSELKRQLAKLEAKKGQS
jgi:hypothetical protein